MATPEFLKSLEKAGACRESLIWVARNRIPDMATAMPLLPESAWYFWVLKKAQVRQAEIDAAHAEIRTQALNLVDDKLWEKDRLRDLLQEKDPKFMAAMYEVLRQRTLRYDPDTPDGQRFQALAGAMHVICFSPETASEEIGVGRVNGVLEKLFVPAKIQSQWDSLFKP